MIEFHDVSFAFDDGAEVFEDLSVRIESGTTLVVMGANGTGKTTLLKLLGGLLEPDTGSISLGVDDPVVGLAPEDPDDGLFAGTVRDELAFFPRNRDLPVEPAVEEALATMGIDDLDERVPQSLSQGEKRLVLLASVLSGDPDVIGLDEPTSGLDMDGRRRFGARLADIDRTVVFATHDADFAWDYAESVLVLDDEGVCRQGAVESLLGDDSLDFDGLGLHEPGPVRWARQHGFDSPPQSISEAAEWLEEGSR